MLLQAIGGAYGDWHGLLPKTTRIPCSPLIKTPCLVLPCLVWRRSEGKQVCRGMSLDRSPRRSVLLTGSRSSSPQYDALDTALSQNIVAYVLFPSKPQTLNGPKPRTPNPVRLRCWKLASDGLSFGGVVQRQHPSIRSFPVTGALGV